MKLLEQIAQVGQENAADLTTQRPIACGLLTLADLAIAEARRAHLLDPIVDCMSNCLDDGGTLFFCGNGGSAADSQHIAAEYVVRYRPGQGPFRAVALTSDTAILTAGANDFGYPQVFARQIEAFGTPKDVLTVLSTSGNSPSCVAAVTAARNLGMSTIAFLGNDGGALASRVDHAYIVRSNDTAHIQEIHLAVQHQIVGLLTEAS